MKHRSSFALRLTLPIVLCTIGVFFASILIIGRIVVGLLYNDAIEKSKSALETATLYVNTSLSEVEKTIENNKVFVKAYRDDTSMFRDITAKVVLDNPGIIGSTIALNPYQNNGMKFSGYSCYAGNPQRIIYTDLNQATYDYVTMDWYQIPMMLGRPVWSEIYYDEGGGNERMTTYSYPMKDEKGEIYAIFTADISLDWLTKKAVSIKPYEVSENLILSQSGAFLTGDEQLTRGETIFSYALDNADSLLLKTGKRIVAGVTDQCVLDINGYKAIGTYGPLANGWSMLIISDLYEVISSAILCGVILFIMLIIAIVSITITSVSIIKKYTNPLKEFSEIVRKIGENNFDNELPVINTNDEIKVLRDAIGQMQSSMKENMLHRQDLQIARFIQSSMVPSPAYESDFSNLYARLEPAKEIGGDMYDYYESDRRNKMFFMVGDVSGKGIPAALFMSMVISSIRLLTRYSFMEEEIVSKVNDNISTDNRMDMFVTFLFGSIDTATRKLRLCNAGHNHPILLSPDGSARFLDLKPNLVGGAMEGFQYECEEFQLEKGSRILLYTDGVTEAERPDLNQYGDERLLAWASQLAVDTSSKDAVDSLRQDVKDFTEYRKYAPEGVQPIDSYPQNDDITIMIISIN